MNLMTTEKAAKLIKYMEYEDAGKIISEITTAKAASYLNAVEKDRASKILDAVVDMGKEEKAALITLYIPHEKAADIVLCSSKSSQIMDEATSINIDSATSILKTCVQIDLEKTASIVENMKAESAAKLLISLARS